MEGTAVQRRLSWQGATVSEIVTETPTVRTLMLAVPGWTGHQAGQHLDVKLTAEDGYTAERSYSIASAPGEPLSITVERLDDGEVSPYLTEEVQPGDEFEVRGPVGGYFVLDATESGPVQLVAGGSGIVPFRSMLRQRQRTGSHVMVRLLYSARMLGDVIYRAELDSYGDGVSVSYTLTRGQRAGWTGLTGRVDAALLSSAAWPAGQDPLAFVCGPTNFVETVADALTGLGYPAGRVKTERFGGTGGR
jgi:ferredoxin-NADP reductase